VVIEIGELAIRIHSDDPAFLGLLEQRYAGFVRPAPAASSDDSTAVRLELDVDIIDNAVGFGQQDEDRDEDLLVRREGRRWLVERGDFRAEWDPTSARGRVRQTANPYSIDAALRVLHTLLLAREGGFLVHAASVIRNGRAFLFAGLSGAGKTTIARLAPPDATLLTDEISYVRRRQERYDAFGTPFTGELARLGENLRAPLEAVYLLAQGKENNVEPVPPADASRALLRHVLFFARDAELPKLVFQAVADFVCRIPVRRLTFAPDARVWELIA
jgi:hypothetical protein